MQEKIRPGYKQTEVGELPEDWDVARIVEVAQIATGSRNTQDRIETGMYPFFVRSQTVERINSYSFDGEAVLTAGDGVGTGKIFHYINGKFDIHQRVYRISNFSDRLNGFFFYIVFSNRFYDRIMSMTAKSSVDSVRREMIADMVIPLPPPAEQIAIAETLADADARIAAVEALIAKKRDLKQAAMQQLLTGKIRLSGFSGDWEVKCLKDVALVFDGTHQTPRYVSHGVPFYSVENVTSGDFKNTKFISPEEHKILTRSVKLERGDILMTRIGSIGDCKLIDWDACASFYVSLALIKVKKGTSAKYIEQYSKSDEFQKEVEVNSLMQAIPKKINLGPISRLIIRIPPTEAEQSAIADILSDMDAELAALKAEAEKARTIKQGMIQNLLTGKVRLV